MLLWLKTFCLFSAPFPWPWVSLLPTAHTHYAFLENFPPSTGVTFYMDAERPGSESPRERGRKEAEPAQQPPGATRSIPLRLRPGTEQKRISRLQSPSAQSYSHRAGCAHDPRLSMWSSGQPLPLCQQGGLGTGQAQSGGHPGGARRVHTKEVTAAVAGGKAEAQRV